MLSPWISIVGNGRALPQRPTKSPCNMSPIAPISSQEGISTFSAFLMVRSHRPAKMSFVRLDPMAVSEANDVPNTITIGNKRLRAQSADCHNGSFIFCRLHQSCNQRPDRGSILKDGRDSSQEEVGSYHGTVYRPAGMKSFLAGSSDPVKWRFMASVIAT